ncbi:hypothetical protein [Bremerella sp.]|uniref:hypothetical protein n=1 Tax=Bremerella sp. TaxID=2795602 RepID=UPI00391DB5C5
MSKHEDDTDLIRRFVETFTILDERVYTQDDPPDELFVEEIDPSDWQVIRWRPVDWQTPPEALGAVRRGSRLPVLYETLVTSYRWPEVNLGRFRLLPNLPAGDLNPLAKAMFADPVLNATLLPAGYVRFAMAADSYDPLCFDRNHFAEGDCPIVCFEHESILMNDTIGKHHIVSATFREWIKVIIDSAT